MTQSRALSELLASDEAGLLDAWIREQGATAGRGAKLVPESERRDQGRELISLMRTALEGGGTSTQGGDWDAVRDLLATISRARAVQGFTPTETATFVLSLKRPLFERLQRLHASDLPGFAAAVGTVGALLDQLALHTTEVFQTSREALIMRQQQDMLELSTPVIKLWDGILALPLIGTLDSARTQVVMETMLQRIVETGAEVAIIDITGVPTVDTLVAQHLIKTVTAARLMGADCIISGIRPQIAQTIVHLGVDLQDVATKATLMDAFKLALERTGQGMIRRRPAGEPAAVAPRRA